MIRLQHGVGLLELSLTWVSMDLGLSPRYRRRQMRMGEILVTQNSLEHRHMSSVV